MDDAALVAGAIGGDREAFGSIYDRYGPRIHDFLCSLLRDRDEAADVLHDTFLVAGARLHQLRDPAKLRPWLYAIARHEGLRRIKARARQEPLGETDVIATGPGPADAADSAALVELVSAAAAGLSPRDRTVLDLHLRQGLDGQELGDAMGVTAAHAYVLLSRLRDQVERSLGALLVTRLGRGDCDGLEAVLAGWDGRFSPLMRKRVARHVDGCAQCSDVRSRAVSPLALLAAVPPVALPDELRVRVLGDLELVSHRGRPWPAGRGGFPPPLVGNRPRRRVFVGAAAALLLVVGGPVALSGPGRVPDPAVSLVDATTPFGSPPAPGQELPPGQEAPAGLGTETTGAGPPSPAAEEPGAGGPSPAAGAPGAGGLDRPAPQRSGSGTPGEPGRAGVGTPAPAPAPTTGAPAGPPAGSEQEPVEPGTTDPPDFGPEDPILPERPTTTDPPRRVASTTTDPPSPTTTVLERRLPPEEKPPPPRLGGTGTPVPG